jgi:hypothetical protein
MVEKRSAKRWLVMAAALLGVVAWFLLGNEPEKKKATRDLRASSSSTFETKSRAPEPPVTAAPQPVAKSPPPVSHVVEGPPVVPGAPEACPPRQPGHGQRCRVGKASALTCAYGDEPEPAVCVCGADDSPEHWKCPSLTDERFAMPQCEPTMPAQGTPCRPRGHTCQYGSWPEDMTCRCNGSNNLQWSCARREYAVN